MRGKASEPSMSSAKGDPSGFQSGREGDNFRVRPETVRHGAGQIRAAREAFRDDSSLSPRDFEIAEGEERGARQMLAAIAIAVVLVAIFILAINLVP